MSGHECIHGQPEGARCVECAARQKSLSELASSAGSALTLEQLQTIVRRDLKNICCIYRTVGAAFFQEAEDRLVQKIAHSIHDAQNSIIDTTSVKA